MNQAEPNSQRRSENHYVAQFQLKRWAPDEQRIWVYRTIVTHDAYPQWRQHSVKGIAKLRDLYSSAVGGDEKDEMERWLSDSIDAPSASVLSKVASERRLTRDDWGVLHRLFAASFARTPAFFIRRRRSWDQGIQSVIGRCRENTAVRAQAQRLLDSLRNSPRIQKS